MKKPPAPTCPTRAWREDGVNDVYDLFVAELEARRERLRQLLDAVTREAARCARPHTSAARDRKSCRRGSATL